MFIIAASLAGPDRKRCAGNLPEVIGFAVRMEGLKAGICIVDNTIVRDRWGLGRGKRGYGVNGEMGGRGIRGFG